jgi:hypothetical protein
MVKNNKSPKYVEASVLQENKRANSVCGDYTEIRRYSDHTDFILCDGMGSGPKANMFATFCASRILSLLENGMSLIGACEKAVEVMRKARTENVPFAAFTLVRVARNGAYTLLSYEAPGGLIISNNYAEVLPVRHFTCGGDVVTESSGTLLEGESIVLCSDGITQAGLGNIKSLGWGIESFCAYINKHLSNKLSLKESLNKAMNQAFKLSNRIYQDDTTLACLTARDAVITNILSGPPRDKKDDNEFVSKFMKTQGTKIVCGSTTLDIVARITKKEVKIPKLSTQFHKPPEYILPDIDIASEGAVTLNQVYNVLDTDKSELNDDNIVHKIALKMLGSDEINFYIGTAPNSAHNDIEFKQLGIMEREKVVTHITEHLKSLGKVVVINNGY